MNAARPRVYAQISTAPRCSTRLSTQSGGGNRAGCWIPEAILHPVRSAQGCGKTVNTLCETPPAFAQFSLARARRLVQNLPSRWSRKAGLEVPGSGASNRAESRGTGDVPQKSFNRKPRLGAPARRGLISTPFPHLWKLTAGCFPDRPARRERPSRGAWFPGRQFCSTSSGA